MKRTQTACFALLASAFVLAAILVIRLDQKTEPNAAHADMVITQPAFTLMTARTRGNATNGEESLFVLDNTGGTLIVYKPEVNNKRLTPFAVVKMSDVFGGNAGGRDRGR